MLQLQLFILLGNSLTFKKSCFLRNLYILFPLIEILSMSYDFQMETFPTTDQPNENYALHAHFLPAVSAKSATFP